MPTVRIEKDQGAALDTPAPQKASQWLILVNSAMGRIQCAARVRVRALNVHMEYQNEGESPDALCGSVPDLCWTGR
jgi:hypothetical protein